MPKSLNILSVFIRASLLAIFCIPQSIFAAQASSLPCMHFLESIAEKQDRPYLELYAQSTIQPNKALKRLPEVRKLLSSDYSPLRQALYLLIQYNIEQAEGDDEARAQGYIKKLKKLGDETEIEWIQTEALFLRATDLVDKRVYEQAGLILADVTQKARKLGYRSLLARAIKWQGNINIDRSEYKRALQSYQEAYSLFSECGDNLQVARVLSNIATLYIRMEEWVKADYYVQQALEIHQQQSFSNAFAEAIFYINASVVDKYLNRPKERVLHIQQAMKLAAKTSSYRVKLTALMNLSAVYLDENQPEDALKSAKSCLELALPFSESRGLAYCHESMGEAYFNLGELDLAKGHAFFALDNYAKLGDRKRYIYISNLIADIYEALGNYKLALKYYKEYAKDNKEYLFNVRRRDLFDLQERFEAKVKEQQIRLLKTENALKSARLAEQKARESSLQVGFIFILFILYWLFRRYTDISRNNEKLEQSNAELATQSMQDPLTKLHNRRYLLRWLKLDTKLLKQPSSLVVLLDIDHFKLINDKLGHDVGDQVLILLAKRLKEIIHCDDLVVRWGGEEFLLIINTCERDIDSVLERLRLTVADTLFPTNAGDIAVTVSIGAVFSLSPKVLQENWESMLAAADRALYNVKSSGRNGYQLATSLS